MSPIHVDALTAIQHLGSFALKNDQRVDGSDTLSMLAYDQRIDFRFRNSTGTPFDGSQVGHRNDRIGQRAQVSFGHSAITTHRRQPTHLVDHGVCSGCVYRCDPDRCVLIKLGQGPSWRERDDWPRALEKISDSERILLSRILDVCGDHENRAMYVGLIRKHSEARVEMALSETKQAAALGKIKKTKGAYLDVLKRLTPKTVGAA